MRIVKKLPFISIRPLVLSYIHDIVDTNRPINTTLDLYDTIIESILEREIKKIQHIDSKEKLKAKTKQWWEASLSVAGHMYAKEKYSITNSELDKILPSDMEKQFRQRSLLTRYGDQFFFSHKSFYDYFMAYRFLLYFNEIKQVYNMESTLNFFDELYNAYYGNCKGHFVNFKTLNEETIANSMFKIGSALDEINHFSQAEPYYEKALKIFHKMDEMNPETFKKEIASTLYSYAKHHQSTYQYEVAEKEYELALKIRRQLANNNKYNDDVAQTINSLANLHRKIGQNEIAEKEYNEALEIHKHNSHWQNMAQTLNNLAVLHEKIKQYDKAEKEYKDALEIRRELAKSDTNNLPYVASTLHNLADLYRDTKQFDKAESGYIEALNIRRQLANKRADAYLPFVAQTLYNYSLLHINNLDYPSAEAKALECLKINKKMAKISYTSFSPYVKKTEELLSQIQQLKERVKLPEELLSIENSIRQVPETTE